MDKKYIDWLQSYSGTFPFVLSLKDSFKKYGRLTPKQFGALTKCYYKEMNSPASGSVSQPSMVQNPTPKPVAPQSQPIDVNIDIVLKRFGAKNIQKEFNLQFPPFTLTVHQIHAQTMKAVLVGVKPTVGDVMCCRICGKDLTDDRSRATGVGPVCAKRYKIPYITDKSQIAQWKAQWKDIVDKIGVLKTWIPKKQIKKGIHDVQVAVASTKVPITNKQMPVGPVAQSSSTTTPSNHLEIVSLIKRLESLFLYGLGETQTAYVQRIINRIKTSGGKLTEAEALALNTLYKSKQTV